MMHLAVGRARVSNPGRQDTHEENDRRRHCTRPWWLTAHDRHAPGSLRGTIRVALPNGIDGSTSNPEQSREAGFKLTH